MINGYYFYDFFFSVKDNVEYYILVNIQLKITRLTSFLSFGVGLSLYCVSIF